MLNHYSMFMIKDKGILKIKHREIKGYWIILGYQL